MDGMLALIIGHGIDVGRVVGTDEQRPVGTPGHLPRLGQAGGIDLDLEARRQLDVLHVGLQLVERRRRGRADRRGEALHRHGLVAQEAGGRRMCPEAGAAAVVAFDFGGLRGGSHAERRSGYRNNGGAA